MAGPLLCADAPHLLYRAFFGLPDSIKGADDRPVNALLGSVNQTLWCVERFKPRAVVMCFGAEAAIYRTDAYPAYHAHRPEMPGDLAHQWALAPDLYRALGWAVVDSAELEADDLMGTLVADEEDRGGEALILSGDRDMYQCVTDKVHVLLQQRGRDGPKELDPAAVQARYGVTPAQVPDFIALRGDPSDGLPGAKGIGEKTAADLLRRHGDLETTLDAAVRERTPTVRRALHEQAAELRSFKDIATLRRIEMDRPVDAPTDGASGAEAAERLGMRRLAERLRSSF
ncbi:MAG: 5'-3' exonuclease [Solirubrobacteraceae bacterium]